MKYIFFSYLLLLSFSSIAQNKIGIGVKLPLADLDLKESLRINDIPKIDFLNDYVILTKDDQDIVSSIEKDLYTQSLAIVTTKILDRNETTIVTNPIKKESFTINITAENNCQRTMIAVFQTHLGALVFLNGVARDILPTTTVTAIPPNGAAYSAQWTIKFPNVNTCNGVGADFFDFSIKKIDNNTYEVKNLSSVAKSLSFYFEKL